MKRDSPPQPSLQCWPASPEGLGRTETAPVQRCRSTGLEAHSVQSQADKLKKHIEIQAFTLANVQLNKNNLSKALVGNQNSLA